MREHYNQNYTKEQVSIVLQIIQDCVSENRFIISKNDNRQENIGFINEYNLRSARQKEIIIGIKPEDFCYTLQNTKSGFEHEVLYVFCPQVVLCNFEGNTELVDVYTKFNIVNSDRGKLAVVISFHKRNKLITYLFR